MCDSRPPRCTGQMTLGTAAMMVLCWDAVRQRVSRIGANPVDRMKRLFFSLRQERVAAVVERKLPPR